MSPTPTRLLTGTAETVSSQVEDIAGDLLDEFDEWLAGTWAGDRVAVHSYVSLYRALVERLVDACHEERPDRLALVGERREVRIEWPLPYDLPLEVLDAGCLDAPASPWVTHCGWRRGVGLHLVEKLRGIVPDSRPLHPPRIWWEADPHGRSVRPPPLHHAFVMIALRELGRDQPLLQRISEALDLSRTEIGRLFGVSRQAVDRWMDKGPPAGRQEKIAAIAELVDLLEHQLRSDRIPGIARRPAAAYGERSMLDLIAEDRHRELLGIVRASFDWSVAA